MRMMVDRYRRASVGARYSESCSVEIPWYMLFERVDRAARTLVSFIDMAFDKVGIRMKLSPLTRADTD